MNENLKFGFLAPNRDSAIVFGTKFTTYGEHNSVYDYIKECYKYSPTNQAIINSYVNYIIGEGLYDKNGLSISSYIKRKDLKLIIQDFYIYGSAMIQVIWKRIDGVTKIDILKHLPTDKVALGLDNSGNVVKYFYSYDFTNRYKYTPQEIPAFDGLIPTLEEDGEIHIECFNIKRTSSEQYFPGPSYESGLEYAEIEKDLKLYSKASLTNGFSASTIVTFKGGRPDSEELENLYIQQLDSKLKGIENAGSIIYNFVDSLEETPVDIKQIETPELYKTYEIYKNTAEENILKSHSVTSPLLFGIRSGNNGLGSNSNEMQEALSLLYKSVISPIQEDILWGLSDIFDFINLDYQLDFKPFKFVNNETNNTEE